MRIQSRHKTILTIALILGLFSSCKKEAIDVNSDFVGNWGCQSWTCAATFTIASNSDGTFQGTYWNESKNESGTVKINENSDKLYIGSLEFTIDQYPYQDDSDTTWKMVLGNDTFKRPQ